MKKLAVDWWIRQRQATNIRLALCWGFAEHCYYVVENGLEANRLKSGWPNSWNSYWQAIAYSSDGNLLKKRRGEVATVVHECLGMATLSGATPQQLPPPQCDAWLTATVMAACPQVRVGDARRFVAYCLWQFSKFQERQAELPTARRLTFVELSTSEADIREYSAKVSLDASELLRTIAEVKQQLEECL